MFSLDYMKIYIHKKGNSRAIHCVSDYGPYFWDTTGMYNNFFLQIVFMSKMLMIIMKEEIQIKNMN